MVVDIVEFLKTKRDEILSIAAKYGAHNVRIFGSVARGEAKSESGLDVLVEFEHGRSLMDHAGLMLDLQELLGCKVDIVTEKGLRPRLREHILAEAVTL